MDVAQECNSYIDTAHGTGCARDQLCNFTTAEILLQDKQLRASALARSADDPTGPFEIGYGGARGGGKSFWLLAQMGVDDCQRFPGLKCLLLRKVGKSNLENFEDLRRKLFKRLPHEFTPSRGLLTFENGSRIIAGHYQNEKDIDSYLGLEYDLIGIEEATTLTWRKYQDISTCCRTSKKGWRPRIYSTTNPGGVGHAWYRKRFITPFQTSTETDTRFIPALVTDNPFTHPQYQKVLSSLTGWQRKAWFHGNWNISAGQFFTTFKRELHVVSNFDTSRARTWWAAMDYGFNHPTVFLLGCRTGDGETIVVDEHSQRGWLPERHSRAFTSLLYRHGLNLHNLQKIAARTDVFSRQFDGGTIAKQYSSHGIELSPANTDRINGWAEVMRKFGDLEANLRPMLFFQERCATLIDCLPTLQHDPARPEDVLKSDCDEEGHGGDDSADALRYLIQSEARPVKKLKLRW